nr:T9SS type A sorting domain-containing protein [uncultured Fluviicola sp.]
MKNLLLFSFLLFPLIPCFAQPANDNPCSATPLTVGTSCSFATYTNAAATASPGVPAPGCASYSGGDVWFSAVVPANGILTVDMNTGVILDSGLAFYSGTCGSLTLIECDDDDSGNGNMSMINGTGLTPGSTVFIRVWEYGGDNNGTFSICASSPVPMTNDDPCTAISLPVNASCSYIGATSVGATNTAGVTAPGCASYSGEDVWFTAVVPATGSIMVNTNSGTMTDSGMAFYTGTCGSLTLLECDDDDSPNGAMSMISRGGLTPGSTVYIRMWDYGGGSGTFSICAVAGAVSNSCGSAATNDNCPSPAILTQGPGTFSASTDVTFTADQPGNVTSVFCGSIENNSWYQFVASSTTHTFPIASVTGCVNNYGIQAQVYNVTYDASGCCTGFTSMSNCFNPGTASTGTVTASGLTIGNTYILMIDGNAGDGCEFTISGWTATGILPVELSEFNGNSTDIGNVLSWKTESEYKNDYFEVMYSRDADHFEQIGTIQGVGTSSEAQEYQFIHQGVPAGTSFYKLQQVDLNGERTESKIISINSKDDSDGLFSVYPNPMKEQLVIQLQSSRKETMVIDLMDQKGVSILKEQVDVNKGVTNLFRDISSLSSGVYTLIITSTTSSQKQRIIKID